jgi:hypothetical protein
VIAGTLIVIFGTLAAPSPAELARGGGLGVSPFAAGAAVWIALWAAFGAWYIRVRSVGRLQWPPRALLDGRLDVRLFADTTGKFSLASALATAFTATYPLRAKHRLMLLAIGIAVIAGSIPLLRRLPTPIGMSVLLSAFSTSSFIVAPAANQVARRTRSLWLAIGKSRRALFGAAERQVWRSNLPRALVSFASLAAMAALSFDLPADLIGRIALVWVGSTVLGAYLGLAEVEGLHALEICIGVAYFGSIALGLYAALGEPRYDLLFGVAAVQLVATAGFRFLAIARWNRLDWLKFRPLRTPAQSVRAGG